LSALEYYPFEYYPYAMPEAYPIVPYYYQPMFYQPPYYQPPVQPIVLRSGPSGIAIAAFILSLIMILLIGGLYFYWRMFYL